MEHIILGASGTLVYTLESGMSLVEYQMDCLKAGAVKNLLPVSVMTEDGVTRLCYQTASRVPLSRSPKRRKMDWGDFSILVRGALAALGEEEGARGFHLFYSGFVWNPDYIFIDPQNFSPMFVYRPVYHQPDWDTGLFKSFVRGEMRQVDTDAIGVADLVKQVTIELNKDDVNLDALHTVLCLRPAKKAAAIPVQGAPAKKRTDTKHKKNGWLKNLFGGQSEPAPELKPISQQTQDEKYNYGEGDTKMMPFLEYKNGETVLLDEDVFIVGREPGKVNHSCKSMKVSKEHARFTQRDGKIYVEDLHSKNKTFINKVLLAPGEAKEILNDDEITMGDTRFTLRVF